MAVTSIQDAKILISSSKAQDRMNGLKNLIHILKHNRGRPALDSLGNKAYLALCETLFQCLREERSHHLRNKTKPGSKSAAALPLTATALRAVVNCGVRTIKSSTVESILDTIVEVLPGNDGALVRPLLQDLPKALKTLLEYQPHVERLSSVCWHAVVDFCIDTLETALPEPPPEEPNSWSTGLSSRGQTPLNSTDVTIKSSSRTKPPRGYISEDVAFAVDDFVHCLLLLFRAPNAPVVSRSERLIAALVRVLRRKTARGSGAALAAINCVFARVAHHSVHVTTCAIKKLLPLMRAMWTEAALREDILIALITTEAHLSKALLDTNDDTTRSDLETLVDTMYSDYRRRQDTTTLQFLEDDYLCFRHVGHPKGSMHPLNTYVFSLETEHVRCEPLWATVSAIAHWSSRLDDVKQTLSQYRADGGHLRLKRTRTVQHYHEYLRHVSETRSNTKRAALQVIAFMLDERPLDKDDMQSTLERLIPYITDDNPVHASWAMIALTSAAASKSSGHPMLLSSWISVWQGASRAVTSVSSSRAASHLMDVLLRLGAVPFSAVSGTIQAMVLSIELSGPSLLTEASASLMTTLIHMTIEENPTQYTQTAERVLNWLLSKWTPSSWPERTYSSLNARHCNARDVLGLLLACLDRPCDGGVPAFSAVLGSTAQAQMQAKQRQNITTYLLLQDNAEIFHLPFPEGARAHGSTPAERHLSQMDVKVLDFCLSELEKAKQRWKEWTQQHSQAITPDMLRIVLNFIVVACCLSHVEEVDTYRKSSFDTSLETFSASFASFLAKRETDQYKVDAVLESFTKNLPDVTSMTSLTRALFETHGVCSLALPLATALEGRLDVRQSLYPEEDDMMDIDEVTDSQAAGGISIDSEMSRHDLQASSDIAALRAKCSAYCRLIHHVTDGTSGNADGVPPSFVIYLTSLHEPELLRCRPLLSCLLSSRLVIDKASCLALLERVSELIDPSAREYNTSEVANGLVLEVLARCALSSDFAVTDQDGQDLLEMVEALYSYYVQGFEKSGVRRSTNLQIYVSEFLLVLLKQYPEFAQNGKAPSVRTSLFELLGQGDPVVKFHIAERLPSVFEDFVLAEHAKILEDIDSSLQLYADWPEGAHIRLLVLSKLAARWHTVLRESVYRIFATAGSDDQTTQHARWCLIEIAKAKHLSNSQALFRLFAPQIVFAWLDQKQKFADLPFSTFEYETLKDLLRDVESEAIGQAIMLGLKDEVHYLAEELGFSAREALARNIGKAGAYTISWDTCKGNARNKSLPSHVNLLQSMIGLNEFTVLMQDNFPRIVGYILQSVKHEERINKAIDKRPAFSDTARALAQMSNFSQSDLDLDIGVEPSFNAHYLFDQLERLCRRTGYDPTQFWDAGRYTFVMRMLLDYIHPALGSLHARAIIRKVRILVALAGPIAVEGYPLQMTLQSLRPFLTDAQCADDTLGIVQYLLEHGVQYLRSEVSFMTGIGLSILISIRVFLGSSQESTTQQSQHKATMSKAQRFHAWFTSYLDAYANALRKHEKETSVKAFRSITSAASRVRIEGNSTRGSEESKLLMEILEDARSGRKLLNKTSREVALGLLCHNFQPAISAREDVLSTEAAIAAYAPQVWDSCRRPGVGEGYLLWAARVLGRAFSAYGEVKKSMHNSSPWSAPRLVQKDSLGKISRAAIIQHVIDLFYSDDRGEVSIAESAIRLLISRLSKEDDYVVELQMAVPVPIGTALRLQIPDEPEDGLALAEQALEQAAGPTKKSTSIWIRDLTISLCHVARNDAVLGSLTKLLRDIDGMAEMLFPYILHLVLLRQWDCDPSVRKTMSEATMAWFQDCDATTASYCHILIRAMLYLRSQPMKMEVTRVDRERWLEVDYLVAARAATTCGNYRSALLFAETSSGQPKMKAASRRSSILVDRPKIPVDLQLSIYKNLDEPDSFYGVDRGASLSSVLDRLDYEADGLKSILFRGARLDSQIRRQSSFTADDSRGLIKSLTTLNMNSVTHSLLSNDYFKNIGEDAVESTLHTARKLAQWDIKAPDANYSEPSTLFKAFQGLHYATDRPTARLQLDKQLLRAMKCLSERDQATSLPKSCLRTLAALSEVDDILNTSRPEDLLDVWDQVKARNRWMQAGDYDDVRVLLSCRETLFSVLSLNASLQQSLRARPGTLRHMEVESLVSSSTIARRHGALQESLACVTYLSDIAVQCKSIGLDIEATTQHEVANVLWDQGEAQTSIRMRQDLIENANFDSQTSDISLPVVLAKLGHHIAEARLAKPDAIIEDYLEPAIKELRGQAYGIGPGQVFHEYALFCDKQLTNSEAAEDIARVKTVMERKLQEHQEFLKLASTDKSKGMRDTYKRSAHRALTWYRLDNTEYERLRKAREQFLKQGLENYLLSLQASDEFDNDALRVFSLWLEFADTTLANEAVKPYLSKVPSGKFALLMNQLSSRLQAETTEFQKLLSDLVFRICTDHPFHGMHQIFAIQMKVGAISREDIVRSKDEMAKSRQRAAAAIAQKLGNDKTSRTFWNTIYRSDELYHHLAMFKNEQDNRQGREIALEKYPESKALVNQVPAMKVPPATLQVEVRADCNYSNLPTITGFKSRMSIANGLSAPKIITALGSDGRSYKQLFKSGNDDLRQDAIMEQVFDQVSRLLKNHTATRLRNLGIRTYKVLPLSTRSGLMEFVQNTMPLHQYVMPAHEKYYSNDWKSDKCRREIANCQSDSQTTRVKVWQKVADNFHPVLRYFLLERFQDPDEWFERRLAYTRSTAAISILGHVLGLGDRHCHNILLDEKSGEVVHIDLGVSFEAGRVLPVPEVVPFRLTRDLVDAMGHTKTEGVFRRCCEFTMDTLRDERESIMTLLNVLRYDPLVNWSVTPTKAKRMQENQDVAANGTRASTVGTPAPTPGPAIGASGSVAAGAVEDAIQESNKKREEQAGEAGRALSVVEKKLSKTLSTRATVNELIQTATDERNLAVLYCGWASYA